MQGSWGLERVVNINLPLPQGSCHLLRLALVISYILPRDTPPPKVPHLPHHASFSWYPSGWSSSSPRKQVEGVIPIWQMEAKDKVVSLPVLPHCAKGEWNLLWQVVFTAGDTEVTQMLFLALGHNLRVGRNKDSIINRWDTGQKLVIQGNRLGTQRSYGSK